MDFKSSSSVNLTSGNLDIDALTFSGDRLNGPSVEIEQPQENLRIAVEPKASTGISMDIPQGDYIRTNIKLKLNDNSNQALNLNGNVFINSKNHPISIAWNDEFDCIFKTEEFYTLLKKQSYQFYLGINADSLFSTVDWNLATIGVNDKIQVDKSNNSKIFQIINSNIQNSFYLQVKK